MAKRVSEWFDLNKAPKQPRQNGVKAWLESLQDAVPMMSGMEFQKIKFYNLLPERQATLDYLNALRLSSEQAVRFEVLCQQAPEYLRPFVDKTHPDFIEKNTFYRQYPAHSNLAESSPIAQPAPEFALLYHDTTHIWPWLVQRATDMLWDYRDYVLTFIFYALFKICGMRSLWHMVLWERVLVSSGPVKTHLWYAPQVAVSKVFFCVVFNTKMYYREQLATTQVYAYVASVVAHNTCAKNIMDVDFANAKLSKDIFDQPNPRLPVHVSEILVKNLAKKIEKKKLESLTDL